MKLNIRAKLLAGYVFILLLLAAVNVYGLFQMEMLADLTTQIYEHPLQVTRAVLSADAGIVRMHRSMKDVVLAKNAATSYQAAAIVNQDEQEVYEQLAIVEKQILGDEGRSLVAEALQAFKDWKPIRDEVIVLVEAGQREEAAAITQGRGAQHVALLNSKMVTLRDYAAGKADEMYANAQSARFTVFAITSLALLGALLIGGAFGFFQARTIAQAANVAAQAAQALAKGDVNQRVEINSRDELGQMGTAFGQMIDYLQTLSRAAGRIAQGDLEVEIPLQSEQDTLGRAFNQMARSLREAKSENERQDWFKTGQNTLNEAMSGDQDIRDLAQNVIRHLSKYLNAQIGALYLVDKEIGTLKLTGSYAFTKRKNLNDTIKIGEGLVGQAAFEQEIISITHVPEDYIRINSALGDACPRNIVVAPFSYEGQLIGVMEFGAFEEFSNDALNFLKMVMNDVAIRFNSATARERITALLEATQQQAQALQIQQEELRVTNEELQEQTKALEESEIRLKEQQEELQATNEELEEKTRYLEEQRMEVLQKNRDLEMARADLQQKAEELAVTSKYKSEFLANMSHELRTPLNSLLILARSLAEDKNGNLSAEEAESAEIIYKSGQNLLELINEILDLSKIEAGQMTITVEAVPLTEVVEMIERDFGHMLAQKGLNLHLNLADTLPQTISTDRRRLEQILKNLLSNAYKFTENGSITVNFHRPEQAVDLSRSGLSPDTTIGISVTDTGIGISPDKQLAIFEAFQQVDSSASRKYSGTGLGLSISRELARLLGGEIQLQSEAGAGSTFTLYLPGNGHGQTATGQAGIVSTVAPPARLPLAQTPLASPPPVTTIADDREHLEKTGRTILIIEDDVNFAKILLNKCHKKGFQGLVSVTGEEGLQLAQEHIPNAIILDINLPGIDGWTVLDALKNTPQTRHIPVHVMSVQDTPNDAFIRGAIGYVAKPARKEDLDNSFARIEEVIEKEIKDLLVVEDNTLLRKGIVQLLSDSDVHIMEVNTAQEAITALEKNVFDCMVLDLGLPDMTGFELLDILQQDTAMKIPPIIIYTGQELSRDEEQQLSQYANSIIVKGARSEERLLNEVTLFLHQMVSKMPRSKQQIILNLHEKDKLLIDKTILLVDDDMRNVFALSKILQEKGMRVLKAEDGQKALKLLAETAPVDLVLMDIMMPVLDGYETISRIRAQAQFKKLPIIALTAKAMKEDREKCIAAGANDYLAKPVDIERLFSMMRVWLYG